MFNYNSPVRHFSLPVTVSGDSKEGKTMDYTTEALIHADTLAGKVDTWADGGDVFTTTTGQYYIEVVNAGVVALSHGTIALSVYHTLQDKATGEVVDNFTGTNANVYVSKEHARKFALEILKALDN